MFKSSLNKGFSMVFRNGFEISVQWGTGNYCSRRNDGDWDESTNHSHWSSQTAEVAIFDTNVTNMNSLNGEDTIKFSSTNDSVVGWMNTDQIAQLMEFVRNAKTFEEVEIGVESLGI